MKRSMILAAAAWMPAACSDPAPAPRPAPTEAAAANETRSVMRPAVIAEIKPEPAPVVVPRTLPSPTIAFERGTALGDEGKAALDALLADAAVPEGARFVLRGHSDTMGGDRDNLVASRRRAEAVAAYLESKGVAADRIDVIALGERRPAAPNARPDGSDDPEGRARNRRVEVEVVAPVPVPPPAPDEGATDDDAPAPKAG